MPLKIITAADEIRVDTIILTLYSPPGVGKTSLAFSADAPLLLDTDAGAYRSAFRKDSVPAASWSDIAGITAADVKPYKTLILDTAGRALDLLSTDIIAGNPKMGRGGALTLQGYGELKARFAAYLTLMRSFGMDIVLVAHSDEKQSGDEVIERLDMQGSSKQEVYKSSDAMARLGIVNGERVLTFAPTDTRFGKDPAGLGRVTVPDLGQDPIFLGTLMRQIKTSLNKRSAEQKKAAEEVAAWARTVANAMSPAQFTALIPKANGNRSQKKVLHDVATSRGFVFDTEKGAYVDPKAPEPEPEPAGATGQNDGNGDLPY